MMAAFTGCMYWKYPGFVTDSWIQFRQSPFPEFVDQYTFFMYFGDYYGKLRENPDTGMYDFGPVVAEHDSGGGDDFERGMLAYHAGDFQVAVEKIEAGIAQRGETENRLYWLGLSYQRLAEQDNCAKHCQAGSSSKFCSLPIVRTHTVKAPSTRAARVFEKLLDEYDSQNTLYRWLLNFSHMTLGDFPDGVPARYRITGDLVDTYYGQKAKQTKARYAHIVLQERAAEMGINSNDCGKGVAVEDFDRDGFLDIITGGTFSALRYYRNIEGRTFEDQTVEAGLAGVTQSHIISAADYDNDGWMDLFVARPFHHFRFFRNNRDGTFKDVTFSSGLLPGPPDEHTAVYSCASTWGDVNNDGYLDLFVSQFGQTIPFMKGLLARKATRSRLYLNVASQQEGVPRRFKDVTDAFGLGPLVDDKIIMCAPFGDYDGDGWTDLYLSSFMGQSVLLHNDGGKRFTKTDLITTPRSGFMAAFLDVNHDGRLDLFHAAAATAMTSTNAAVFDCGSARSTSAIYLQTNDRFVERPDLFDGGMRIGSMGVAYGDINNDGACDFYFGTGNVEGAFVLPNAFFIGQTDGRQPTGLTTNASMLNGLGSVQKGHAIVFFDFDHDGDQDIYQSLGGMWPGDKWPNQFFVNESQLENSWVKIRLRGRQTNYYGVGAWIRVFAKTASGEELVRRVYMHNNTGFGSAPYLAHIGLMDADTIERVEVQWPVSKTTKSYNVQIDSFHVLDEDGSVRAGF